MISGFGTESVPVSKNNVDLSRFNQSATLPFNLRLHDFHLAMQDVYDFFFDVNQLLEDKGQRRPLATVE